MTYKLIMLLEMKSEVSINYLIGEEKGHCGDPSKRRCAIKQ